MIDPCNSNADFSKVADVFLYVLSFVPYSELNKKLVPYPGSLSLFDCNIFSKHFMLMLYLMIFMIDPNNSYADISEITATAVSVGVYSSVLYLLLNKEQVPYSLSSYEQHIFKIFLCSCFMQ
jgi:hypothetical protein